MSVLFLWLADYNLMIRLKWMMYDLRAEMMKMYMMEPIQAAGALAGLFN